MTETQRFRKSDGTPARSDTTAWNQAVGAVQPRGLTDESLPSPEPAMSTLFDLTQPGAVMDVAVLYVETGGCYFDLPGVDP